MHTLVFGVPKKLIQSEEALEHKKATNRNGFASRGLYNCLHYIKVGDLWLYLL